MPLVRASAQAKAHPARAPRARAAGGVLRGPSIAITCECGDKRDLGYGEDWACETCGRHWDTNQIPVEQYDAIRRTQLRFRVLPVVYGVVVAGTAIFFMLTGNIFSVFVLLPLAMMLWFYSSGRSTAGAIAGP